MMRLCENCEAETERPFYCSDRCSAAARQQRLRAKDRAQRAAASVEVISVGFTIAVLDDDREIDPEVRDIFADEVRRGYAMARALRRKRRPIRARIPRIDRADLAALDEAEAV